MNDRELEFPQWQGPLQEAILEFDPQKLAEKIRTVEALIPERLQQLDQGKDGHAEKTALHDAQAILRIMKRDRLAASGRD